MGQTIKKRKYWRKKSKAMPTQKPGIIDKIKSLCGVKKK